MTKSNVIDISAFLRERGRVKESKDTEQYECDCYEDFIAILESYFKPDSKEYMLMIECYEEAKERLTLFYLSAISSVVDNPNNLSLLAEDSFGEIAYPRNSEEDMNTNFICEREACCLALHLLWILQKEKE